jgi:hypothetical protein
MRSGVSVGMRWLLVAAALAVPAVLAVPAGADDTVLNQTRVSDPVGDAGTGVDFDSVVVTTYADGTISFSAHAANRPSLGPNETVQMFVDLNDDRNWDLNLSLWPSNDPSYLDRWDGTKWADIRQLPELVEHDGTYSVRLSLGELRDAAAVPISPTISLLVGSWTLDPNSDAGLPISAANDLVPGTDAIHHVVAPAAPAAPTTTTTPAPPPAPKQAPKPAAWTPPRLTLACRSHTIVAHVTAGTVALSSVAFSVGGRRVQVARAPFTASIRTTGLHAPFAVSAAVHLTLGTPKTLHGRLAAC